LKNEHAAEIQEMQQIVEEYAEKEREAKETLANETRESTERDEREVSLQ